MATIASMAAATAFLALQATAQQFVMYTPGGDDTVGERIDPILAPGTIGQHVHQVFGSNALAPEVTYEDLLASTCTTMADASNRGNSLDHSIYWHPALYMEASNGTGYVKVPTNGHKLYYKDAGSNDDKKADPFEFPHGFRMVAGHAWQRAPPSDAQQQNITQWICHADSGSNQGTYGGFPTGVSDCASVDGFNGAIHFPHCWNGDAFDQSNPFAHIVYPEGDIQNGVCPDSHPTRLPHLFMENTFDIHSVVDQVKADSFVLAHGDNTGLGWHADFFNGWEDGAIPNLLASCPDAYYGNEDVGVCTAFVATSTPASECKLKSFYSENTLYPGQNLPGCNPVRDSNPAPIYAIAPLGTYSVDCTLANLGSAVNSTVGGVSSVLSNVLGVATSSTPSSEAASTDSSSTDSSSSSVTASPSAFPTTVDSADYASTDSTALLTVSTSAAVSATTFATSVTASSSSSVTAISTVTSTSTSTSTDASSSSSTSTKKHHTSYRNHHKAYTTPAPLSADNVDYVTVFEVVTVTVDAPSKRHVHRHLDAHRRNI